MQKECPRCQHTTRTEDGEKGISFHQRSTIITDKTYAMQQTNLLDEITSYGNINKTKGDIPMLTEIHEENDQKTKEQTQTPPV